MSSHWNYSHPFTPRILLTINEFSHLDHFLAKKSLIQSFWSLSVPSQYQFMKPRSLFLFHSYLFGSIQRLEFGKGDRGKIEEWRYQNLRRSKRESVRRRNNRLKRPVFFLIFQRLHCWLTKELSSMAVGWTNNSRGLIHNSVDFRMRVITLKYTPIYCELFI